MDIFKYRAFISYCHEDERWARWLHRRLEGYHVPKNLHQGQDGETRLRPVFRDREELASAHSLSEAIREALASSETLVVICSHAASRSYWVNEEVCEFLRLDRANRIFCCIIEGSPPDTFPEALLRGGEPLAADFRKGKDGRRDGLTKLVAGILGVSFDDLRQREAQRRHRRQAFVTGFSLAGMMLMSALTGFAWFSQQQAIEARSDSERRREQAEQLLSFMVGELRESLEPLGKLGLLNKVADQATAYFDSADKSDISDHGLATKAEVLTQIGEIRTAQYQYAEALDSFEQAFRQSAKLSKRHPNNSEMLYHRSQAEFWVGYISWRNGDLEAASQWMSLYRDTAVELTALEPSKDSWLLEVAYGDHNLAVLWLERGDTEQAERLFREETIRLRQILSRSPESVDIQESLADAVSWLGMTSEWRGNLELSLANHVESRKQREQLLRDSPENKQTKLWAAVAVGNEASIRSILDERDEAQVLFTKAKEVLESLLAFDPANKQWQRYYYRLVVDCAELALSLDHRERSFNEVKIELKSSIEGLNRLHNTESHDRRTALVLIRAYRILAALELPSNPGASAGYIKTTWPIVLSQYSSTSNDLLFLSEIYMLVLLGGQLSLHNELGMDDLAQKLRVKAKDSSYARLLDPLLRDLIKKSNPEAQKLKSKLEVVGYKPVWPWPRPAQYKGVNDVERNDPRERSRD